MFHSRGVRPIRPGVQTVPDVAAEIPRDPPFAGLAPGMPNRAMMLGFGAASVVLSSSACSRRHHPRDLKQTVLVLRSKTDQPKCGEQVAVLTDLAAPSPSRSTRSNASSSSVKLRETWNILCTAYR